MTERHGVVLIVDIYEHTEDSDYECHLCDETFDRDEWEELGGFHYRSGGETRYGCPNEDCNGEIHIVI